MQKSEMEVTKATLVNVATEAKADSYWRDDVLRYRETAKIVD